jgi:putative hydrolase of the HAD superfamily
MLESRIGLDAAALHARMREVLREQGRGHVFDVVLAEHGTADPALVAACVETYRTHEPDIDLSPDVRTMLADLAPHGLYLVTDGDPDVQARKIAALGLAPYFVETYRTWSYGREAGKPSLFCFDLIRTREGCAWADLTYVGDDPSKDFVKLRAMGARTVRVHTGRCADAPAAPGFDADEHVAAVTDVPMLLGLASGSGG